MKLLTPRDVAERLSLRLSTVYRWAYDRRIPTVKIGNMLRFREEDIVELINKGFRPSQSKVEREGR